MRTEMKDKKLGHLLLGEVTHFCVYVILNRASSDGSGEVTSTGPLFDMTEGSHFCIYLHLSLTGSKASLSREMAVHSPYNHAPPLTQEINGQKPTLAPAITLERPADCINRGQYPAFYIICGYLNRLRADAPHKKYELLMRIFGNWREKVGPDLYPLIRLLLPDVSLCVTAR